jgi:NADH dehydrogenase [ubiquinone] 1 alpha subcomplex assembly factor 1
MVQIENIKQKILFDFSKSEDSNRWNVLNDDVMGGISTSKVRFTKEGTLLFEGNISLENNGGFASIRSGISDYNFNGFNGILIRIKGDGKTYGFSMRETENFTGYNFTSKFKTEKNTWQIIHLPFEEFKMKYLGKTTKWQPSVIKNHIKQLSFIISDKQNGLFQIEIAWIKLY